MTTASELLEATNAAILKTLTSQEYDLPGGQRKKMAALDSLRKMRAELTNEIAIASESSGSMCSLLQMGEAS